MSRPTLRICHLYPSVLSVAGDRGNLMAIQRRCSWRGIDTEVTEVSVGSDTDYSEHDLVLFHGGQDKEMTLAATDIQTKADGIRRAVESDVAVLAVCAGLQLLGHYYQPSDGPRLDGIGVLDLYTVAGSQRYMNHIAVECDFTGSRQTLVGFENHSGRTFLGERVQPLGRVLAGGGNNGEDGTEGARYREVYATYMHGPVLPKNPWFTDHLIEAALRHRYGRKAPELQPLEDAAESRAHARSLEMALALKGKRTALEPARWA